MGIDRIAKNSLAKITPSLQTLRPGQIVQGKIVKLYPNNKAEIQLGSQKLVAQVKAPLTIGEKYHFQVQTTGDVIHLKVLGEQLKGEERINVKHLLQQLGLKATKLNIALTNSVMNEKIAFDKNQLAEAFQLLEGSKTKEHTQSVLKDMIVAKLPITNSVLQALSANHESGITDQMKTLLQPLKQNENYPKLTERLSQMIETPLNAKTSLIKQIITESKQNNPQLFKLLSASGAIHPSIDFSTWKSQWEAFESQKGISLMNTSPTSQQGLNKAVLPFEMDSAAVYKALEQILSNKPGLQTRSQEILQLWGKKLGQININNQTLTGDEFTVLKQQFTQKIMPFLTTKQQRFLSVTLQNDSFHLRQLLNTLQTLNTNQDIGKLEELLTKVNLDKTFLVATPKEQFLSQINQMLRFTGISYENQLLNSDIQQQSNTVKAMLLQMLQTTDGDTHERGQQLLHFINGMQITAVNEVNNFIQANLQIPGERIGLNSDIELKFEGNKTKSGEINPDYCRIIFYLDLSQLKKTIIDMNIHKRAVSVTVFNDTDHLKDVSSAIQPVLKQGLNALDYHLSAITFQQLSNSNEPKLTNAKKTFQGAYQGVDFQI